MRLLAALLLLLQLAAPFKRPNPKLTPGDILTHKKSDVCTLGWAGRHRHVTPGQHYAIFGAYGIPWANHRTYEDDHLVSLQLGGSNDNRNRWPQPYPQAYSKDSLENVLHAAVCKGRLPLDSAQRWIAHDWVSAYRAMKRGKL
jgi:hypothetical protein